MPEPAQGEEGGDEEGMEGEGEEEAEAVEAEEGERWRRRRRRTKRQRRRRSWAGPSEDFVGVTPVNSSCTGTAMGHVTSYGCTGVWSVGKLVPMICGLVNRGKICGHSMCSLPADLLFYPPPPSHSGPVWAFRGLCLIENPVKVASKTRTINKR